MVTCHSAYGFERSTLLCAAPSSCKEGSKSLFGPGIPCLRGKVLHPKQLQPVSTLNHHEASGAQVRKVERRNAEWKELARPSQESLDQEKWKSYYNSKELNTNKLRLS